MPEQVQKIFLGNCSHAITPKITVLKFPVVWNIFTFRCVLGTQETSTFLGNGKLVSTAVITIWGQQNTWHLPNENEICALLPEQLSQSNWLCVRNRIDFQSHICFWSISSLSDTIPMFSHMQIPPLRKANSNTQNNISGNQSGSNTWKSIRSHLELSSSLQRGPSQSYTTLLTSVSIQASAPR